MADTEVGAEIWTQAELNLGIVSACLPIFKPLYRKVKATVSALRTNDMSSNPQLHSKTLVYSYGVPGGKVPISKSQRVVDDMSDSHIDMELGTVIHVTRDFDVSSFGGKSRREFEQY